MFNPHFKYTQRIVNNLLKITNARDVILNSKIIPKWEVSLRRDALISSAHSSTAIEGNKLTLEEVSQLAQGRKITAARKEKQEVLNYLNVLTNIHDYHDNGKITEKLLLKLHKDVTYDTLDNPQDEGTYRQVQVYVGNKLTGEVVFMPPKIEEVQKLVQNLLARINQETEISPVMLAGLTHYEFVRIHPFVDGNGRTARALATLILYIRDFDIKRFFALDDYYDSDRKAYYAALKTVDKNTLETTQWLEYFTDGVLISLSRVKDKIISFSMKKTEPQIALTERQMKILEMIVTNGKITSGEIQDLFKITRQAVHKELKKMIELGVIEPKGENKAIYYTNKTG
ncbi:Fic family protein [Candidatus Woesearchaeota archaeon]|nr:Fic family protein [Candidatus Woesearchaeota archaeon]